jgi:hypothetical protein
LLTAFSLLALLLPQAAGVPEAGANDEPWTITCVDCPHRFGRMTDRALQFDALGQPHVAYGGSQLYYAFHSGAVWQVEVADATRQVGSDAALALDSTGQPHISYSDEGNQDLRYAYRNAAGWHVETVESQGRVGKYTSLALDSQGYAHISYRNLDTGELRYAFRDGEDWHVETADPLCGIAWMTSLALDAQGRPHVAYLAGAPYEALRWAVRDSTGWQVETVDDQGKAGWYPSIAVDAQGGVHISYGKDADALGYAFRDGAGWRLETIDSDGDASYVTSLVLDSSGRPHVSYLRTYAGQERSETRHTYRDDAGWHGEIAYLGGNWVDFTSLALDNTDRPCIALSDRDAYQSPASLLLACQQPDDDRVDAGPPTWAVEIIDAEGETGQESSLAIDALGRPHVAYTGAGLVYAWSTGLPAAGVGEYLAPGWQGEPVDSQGAEPSLALDSAGVPHLAYTDVVTRDLRYAIRTASGWQMETVDADASAPSLVLDAGDRPHIGYASAQGIVYAYRDAAGWQAQVVDPRGGSQVSLALDASGQPRLAYLNRTGDLRYVYRAGALWYSQIVAVAEDTFSGPSLALDQQSYPHISFSEHIASGYRLWVRHACQDAAGWHVEDVQRADYYLGARTSLAFDQQGSLHMGFDDGDSVWHATAGVTGWQVEPVVGFSWLRFSGLALDRWSRPFIVFYDAQITHGLMLAARGPALDRVWLPLVGRH